jgi:hypothetical protein
VVRIVTTEAEGLKARLNAETHAATLAALASLTRTKATSTGTTMTSMNDETLKEYAFVASSSSAALQSSSHRHRP